MNALPDYETPASAATRFIVELIAWTAGPWAVAQINVWLAVPAAVLLVAAPAIFSTPGDKRNVIVPTPGRIRVVIEIALHVVAAVCPWIVWPAWLAATATAFVAVALALGVRRIGWLIRN